VSCRRISPPRAARNRDRRGEIARLPIRRTIASSRGTYSGAANTILVAECASVCSISASCASRLIGDTT
jgi:hypothetical protein